MPEAARRHVAARLAPLAAALLLGACSAMPKPAPKAPTPAVADALDGSRWRLARLGDAVPPEATAPTLAFAGGRAEGSDGCNRFRSDYRLASGRLEIAAEMVTTRAACPEPVLEQADAYLETLVTARAVRIDGEMLQLLDASGERLAEFVAEARPLAGSAWLASDLAEAGRLVAVPPDADLGLRFADGGRAGGSAGCNAWRGSYAQDGKTLRFEAAATSRKACAPAAMVREAAFLAALAGSRGWRLDGPRLELLDADGTVVARFVPDRP